MTHDDNRRSRCHNATLLSHNNFRTAEKDLHAITSRSATSKVVHTPKASLGVRVITVSSTSIFATKQRGADVHHTASFHAIHSPAHASSKLHARAMHRSSTGDTAMSRQLSAESSSRMYLPSTGSSRFSAWHFLQNAVAGTFNAAPNKFAAHGSPCGTERDCSLDCDMRQSLCR